MNWDQIEGKWKQAAGSIKERWGKLTDDDLTVISGRKDQLVGKIQERYGIAREEAHRQVEEFARAFRPETNTTAHDAESDEARHEKARRAGKS